MSLNMVRINLFVKSKMSDEEALEFRSKIYYLIKNRYLKDDVIAELNKVIELEDIMDNPGSEALSIISKAHSENI